MYITYIHIYIYIAIYKDRRARAISRTPICQGRDKQSRELAAYCGLYVYMHVCIYTTTNNHTTTTTNNNIADFHFSVRMQLRGQGNDYYKYYHYNRTTTTSMIATFVMYGIVSRIIISIIIMYHYTLSLPLSI